MSRILQALKQLETRPEATPPAVPVAAAPPVDPAPAAPLPRSVTERIEPRRKRKKEKVRRAARTPEAILADAAEIERLLNSLGPGVVECWHARGDAEAVVVNVACDSLAQAQSSIVVHDQTPAVVSPPSAAPPSAPAPLVPQAPQVIENWSSGAAPHHTVVNGAADLSLAAASSSIVVHDHVPQVVEITAKTIEPRRVAPHSAPPLEPLSQVINTWSENEAGPPPLIVTSEHDTDYPHAGASVFAHDYAPQVIAAPPAEIAAHVAAEDVEPALPLVIEINEEPDPEPDVSEVELEFAPSKPRRTPVVEKPKSKRSGRRKSDAQREAQARTLVRGPRDATLARPTAWETTVAADLEEPRVAVPIQQLVDGWRKDRHETGAATLLLASLGAPLAGAEIALRAAVLLARSAEESVLVIDADPEAALSRRLGITGKPGLSELLSPTDAYGETIQPTATARLHVLPRGRSPWPALLGGDVLGKLLDDLAREYAWIIVVCGDTASPAAQAFARTCRGAYVVAPLGEAELSAAERQLAALRTAGARLLGAVVAE
jgi:Mrp family chromosome partitioning ATPase